MSELGFKSTEAVAASQLGMMLLLLVLLFALAQWLKRKNNGMPYQWQKKPRWQTEVQHIDKDSKIIRVQEGDKVQVVLVAAGTATVLFNSLEPMKNSPELKRDSPELKRNSPEPIDKTPEPSSGSSQTKPQKQDNKEAQ